MRGSVPGTIFGSVPRLLPTPSTTEIGEEVGNILASVIDKQLPYLYIHTPASWIQAEEGQPAYTLSRNFKVNPHTHTILDQELAAIDLINEVGEKFHRVVINAVDGDPARMIKGAVKMMPFDESRVIVVLKTNQINEQVIDAFHSHLAIRLDITDSSPPVSILVAQFDEVREPVTQQANLSFSAFIGPWAAQELGKLPGSSSFRHWGYSERRAKDAWWDAIREELRNRKLEDERPANINLTGTIFEVKASKWVKMNLERRSQINEFRLVHGKDLNWMMHHLGSWTPMLQLHKEQVIIIADNAIKAMDKMIDRRDRIITPIEDIPPQMRLGWLSDQNRIKCIKKNEESNFDADKWYDIRTRTVSYTTRRKVVDFVTRGKKAGEWVERQKEQKHNCLEIRIKNERGQWKIYYDRADVSDVAFIVEHFQIPDPGSMKSRYPEEVEKWTKAVLHTSDQIHANSVAWMEEHEGEKNYDPIRLRRFQVEGCAAMLTKGSGLLAYDPGLGKTVMGATLHKTLVNQGKAKDTLLIIAPQDLHVQWIESCQRFFGVTPQSITTHEQARTIRQHIKRGGTGWYITHYEAISRRLVDKSELLPVRHIRYDTEKKWDPDAGQWVEEKVEVTSEHECPICKSQRKYGWDGTKCQRCGYLHYAIRIKPLASLLTMTFRKGSIILDEATQIQGQDSKRSMAVRGLQSSYRFAMTGTPIKNYVAQAYWPLWWCLRNNSERFPYGWSQQPQFEREFAVWEWVIEDGKKRSGKALPLVTNLSQLWRLLAASVVRRRQETTGERLQPIKIHEKQIGLSLAQSTQYSQWLTRFPDFFAEKYPNSKVVRTNMHIPLAPMLGLNWKVDYATTMPLADPDWQWTGVRGLSNFTPANFEVLSTALNLVKQGRKVLLGSNLVGSAEFFAEELARKGVNVLTLLEAGQTASPARRAKIVHDFQHKDVDVLCASVQALRLGHNIDAASACIIHGLPWDYEGFYQFIKRVHRFTSKKPVDVYVMIPSAGEGRRTSTERKWELMGQKIDTSNLVLDGQLVEQDSETISDSKVLRELIDEGFLVTGAEPREEMIHTAWNNYAPLSELEEPDESILGVQAVEEPWVPTYTEIWDDISDGRRQTRPPFWVEMPVAITEATVSLAEDLTTTITVDTFVEQEPEIPVEPPTTKEPPKEMTLDELMQEMGWV